VAPQAKRAANRRRSIPIMGVFAIPVIVVGILIGCFFRYVLKRPGEHPPEGSKDNDDDQPRWNAGWF
jgi:hypothetical protein